MSEKKYWQSFGELNQSEANKKALKDEFKEGLPIEALGSPSLGMKKYLMPKPRDEIS